MKQFIILLAALAAILPARARTTAAEAFASAPADVFMLLERNDRLDMIDYFTSGLGNSVSNALDGSSRITSLTDDALTIEMTPSSTYQLAILPGRSAEVIALIITIATPTHDSRLQFYLAPDWTPVDSRSVIDEPTLETWLNDAGRSNAGLVESLVPFIMASYTYDAPSQTLTATNELSSFLSPDIYDMIKDYMRPQVQYKWDGRKFQLRK